MSVRIIPCTSPTKLFRHYDGQSEPQPAYIELDLRHGTLLADYNSEVGNGVPGAVYHGFERRYRIPALTAEAANQVMEELVPLAERILADWKEEWDGNNMVARLGEDAQEAEEEIQEKLGLNLGYGDYGADTQGFDSSDVVVAWDIDVATNGNEVDDYDITADTTDERLDEIEKEILADLAECGEGGVVVCHGLDDYLRGLRDELADEDPLTPAELRTAREQLGLTGEAMANLLREQGRDPIPGRIRPEVAELKAETAKAVAQMVAGLDGDEALITYRNDDEYKAAHPGRQWTASWHRQVCARAAEESGARIDYAGSENTEDEA